MSRLIELNYSLFQRINAFAGSNAWLDAVMIFCANALIFCLPILLVLAWGPPMSWRRKTLAPDRLAIIQERRATVLWIAIACLLAYGLNLLIEQFVFEPRPFVSHHVHLLIQHAPDGSFPSDHTAWAFAVTGMFAFLLISAWTYTWRQRQQGEELNFHLLRFPLILTIAALLFAVLIGLARVFVGVHYPGDILGGAVDGLLAAGIVTPVRRWLHLPTNAILHLARILRLA